jgi:hypothetical protein
MEKFNWKQHAKDSLKGLPEELYYIFCISVTLLLVLFTQTEKQLKVIQSLFEENDWVIISLAGIGIIIISAIVAKIPKWIFYLLSAITLIIVGIIETLKNKS